MKSFSQLTSLVRMTSLGFASPISVKVSCQKRIINTMCNERMYNHHVQLDGIKRSSHLIVRLYPLSIQRVDQADASDKWIRRTLRTSGPGGGFGPVDQADALDQWTRRTLRTSGSGGRFGPVDQTDALDQWTRRTLRTSGPGIGFGQVDHADAPDQWIPK
jgi:hypothetical protein